jgi:translocation and assembly module TamA
VHVELRELAPFALGYQFRWNDDTGASGDVEGQVRNLFGRAIALGARYERGSDEQVFRGSLVMPSFFGRGNITLTAFRTEEQPALGPDLPPDTPRDNILERGGEFLQALHLPNRWDALFGYRFMRSTITSPFFLEPISENIAALETSLLRETRDNPLNARQGRFWSLSLEYSPEFLGSSFTFVKGFGQFFTFRSVGPSLTWSQGYRIGLAHGFGGQDLVSTERFNAGGGNSVRGYATDTLGPVDIFGDPAGGDAVLIFNQELRYLHRSGFGAAAFWDAGNVFAKASDLSLSLRHALGTGLRWDSPIGLLRLDIGFPLGRREGDKAYRVFFSLGQAF